LYRQAALTMLPNSSAAGGGLPKADPGQSGRHSAEHAFLASGNPIGHVPEIRMSSEELGSSESFE
jgi:hypothetical protein